MSDAISHIEVLHNNPFVFAALFPRFYENLGKKPKSLLLAYLVLPLALRLASRQFLKNANRRSSVRTMVKRHEVLYGLPSWIEAYRQYANASIQYLIDQGVLTITEDLNVLMCANSSLDDQLCPMDSATAAGRLGVLLAPYDVPTAYRLLGITEL